MRALRRLHRRDGARSPPTRLRPSGLPAELLTDNGPPYKAWQGTTEFQKILQKEDVKHILARPHFPETLGKIEF